MDLKNLKALIKIMRNEGVLSLKTPDIDLQLAPEALFPSKNKSELTGQQSQIPSDNPFSDFPDGILSDTQLAFYSAGGDPSEDPENQN